jgi:hypothetical protein
MPKSEEINTLEKAITHLKDYVQRSRKTRKDEPLAWQDWKYIMF